LYSLRLVHNVVNVVIFLCRLPNISSRPRRWLSSPLLYTRMSSRYRDACSTPLRVPLEGVAGVAQAEGHAGVLKQAKLRDDGGLRDVSGVHGYLVVPLLQVDPGEVCAPCFSCGEIQHVGHWISVRYHHAIEAAVVTAGPPGAVLFWYHVEWGSPGAVGASYYPSLLQG
jgi:hypothetical protein